MPRALPADKVAVPSSRTLVTTLAKLLLLSIVIFGFFASMSSVANSANLYRYKDENGKTVLERYVPPDVVPRGYDILNESGRLLERVPPALTQEQKAQRDAERARLAEIERQKQRSQAIDRELVQVFGTPDGAVRILERRVQDIHRVLQVKILQIAKTERRILKAEQEAAELQRKGQAVTDALLQRIENFRSDIVNFNSEVQELTLDRQQLLDDFDEKITRLEKLTEEPSANYKTLLDTLNLEHKNITQNVAEALEKATSSAEQLANTDQAETPAAKQKKTIKLSQRNLQGTWHVMVDGKKSEKSWLFEEDQMFQIIGEKRLAPDVFRIVDDKLDLGFTQVRIAHFNGQSMQARFAGEDYTLEKQ